MLQVRFWSVFLALLSLLGCGADVVLGPEGGGGGSGGEGGEPQGAGPSETVSSSTSTGIGGSGPADILDQLNEIPGASFEEWSSDYPDYRWFVGTFEQPADHSDPDGLKFQQRIYILHRDAARPSVLLSTGYNLWEFDYLSEPTLFIDGNQISVEHRFFEPSRPEPADWANTLTIEQAAADHHRIVEAFRPLYPANWISTGASKGGMTSMYHRRFYPNDVQGTVPYVAPLSYGLGDPRYIDFLDEVGPVECREALKAVQVAILSRREAMLDYVQAGGASYSHVGEDAALDLAVEALRFLIWQYYDESACFEIPTPEASDDHLYAYLQSYAAVEGSADENIEWFEPYYFQAATQLGDPGTDESYMAPYLSALGMNASAFVLPGPTKQMVFQPQSMADIQSWTIAEGSRLLFVYGENDPWSAAAFEVSGSRDTHSFTMPLGNHGAGVYGLEGDEYDAAVDAISRWAGLASDAARPPSPSPAQLEVARLGRLIDSTPSARKRSAWSLQAERLKRAR